MRGKGDDRIVARYNDRITPAYAGKSEERNQKNSRAKDHPRLCGEKKKCSVEITRLKGSPPPMRGKVKAVQDGSR